MASSFPTSIDNFSTPTATSPRNNPSLADSYNLTTDAVSNLEAKVGVNSSAVVTSLDYLLKSTSSSNPGHKHTLANGATDVTSTFTQLNYLNIATGTTGTGRVVYQTSPTLTAPTMSVATIGKVNGVEITNPANSIGHTILTLSKNSSFIMVGEYSTTLTATNTTTLTLPTTGTLATTADITVTPTSTTTLTNKRITKRVTSITSSATPTINTDDCDVVDITALAAAINTMSTNLTGTPTNKQTLVFEIKDDGTARAITWGASFVAGGVALPTTTVISKILTVGFMYSTANALNKWRCVASIQET